MKANRNNTGNYIIVGCDLHEKNMHLTVAKNKDEPQCICLGNDAGGRGRRGAIVPRIGPGRRPQGAHHPSGPGAHPARAVPGRLVGSQNRPGQQATLPGHRGAKPQQEKDRHRGPHAAAHHPNVAHDTAAAGSATIGRGSNVTAYRSFQRTDRRINALCQPTQQTASSHALATHPRGRDRKALGPLARPTVWSGLRV